MNVSAADFAFDTQRLHVRPMCEGDQALFCDLYCDPQSMRLIGTPLSREAASRLFRQILGMQQAQPMRCLSLVIEAPPPGLAIGLVGCPGFDPCAERVEIGLMLRRLAHGNGYPREVLVAFVRRLFTVLPLGEVWAQYPAANKAADRAVRNIGFDWQCGSHQRADPGAVCIRAARRQPWLAQFLES